MQHAQPPFPSADGWRFDRLLTRPNGDRRSSTHIALCSRCNSSECETHIAKFLDPRASEIAWLSFERQAYVATRLEKLAASWLEPPQPLLVFPHIAGARLDDWLAERSQFVTRLEWVGIATSLLMSLEELHRLGYVHCQVRPEHVWLRPTADVSLLGLGACQPVGHRLAPRGEHDSFDAPEWSGGEGEISSAQDIYSAAAVIDLLSGGDFVNSPVGRCMQAAEPYQRPTARELVELFQSYERELLGDLAYGASRAASRAA